MRLQTYIPGKIIQGLSRIIIGSGIIALIFSSCISVKDREQTERDIKLDLASKFLEQLKTNDTSKIKAMIFGGSGIFGDEIFAHNVKVASELINKYGLPKKETMSFKDEGMNVTPVTGIICPMYKASNPNDKLQKAEIEVYVQMDYGPGSGGNYIIIMFTNNFENNPSFLLEP